MPVHGYINVEIPGSNTGEMNFYEIVCFNDGGSRCRFYLGCSFRVAVINFSSFATSVFRVSGLSYRVYL